MRAAYWWVDRWLKSTAYADLTLEEQGGYRNLLDQLWLRGGVLPNDERILGKCCGDALAWPKIRDRVMARFTLTPDGWRNETHDEVAESSDRYLESQAAKGRKRAEQATRTGGRFTSPDQPNHQPSVQPRVPAAHQPPGPGPGPGLGLGQGPGMGSFGTLSAGADGVEPKSPRKAPVHTPREQIARDLKRATGSGLDRCRDQVTSLLAAGLTIEAVRAGLHYAEPGMAPWDWSKRVRGNGRAPNGGLTASQILDLKNLLPDDHP